MRNPNDKRFTVKILGVFQMDTENFTPTETRKTITHFSLWIIAILCVWKLLNWLTLSFS